MPADVNHGGLLARLENPARLSPADVARMLRAAWRWLRQLRVPLRVKAAILVGGVAAVAVLSFGLLQAWFSARDLHARAVDDQVRLAAVVSALVEDYVRGIQNDLVTTARDERFIAEVAAGDTAAVSRRLETIGRVETELSALIVVDPSGIVIASSRPVGSLVGVSVGDRDYLQAALQTGETVIGDARRGAATDRPVVPMAVPIRGADGATIAVLQGSLLLTRLNERIDSLRVGQRGYVSLVDGTGTVIAHPDPDRVLTPATHYAELREATASGQPSAQERVTAAGAREFVVAVAVPSTRWLVQIRTPMEEIDAPIRQQLINTAAAAAVAFTVAVAIGLFVSQQLTDPIAELQRATSRLANEDYSAALPDVRTRDELEDVAVDFATMVRRLRSTMERLASQVAESEQQRARLAAILQSIDEAILLVGPDGRVLIANEGVRRLFDFDPASLAGKPDGTAPGLDVLSHVRLAEPELVLDLLQRAEQDPDLVFTLDVLVLEPVKREISLTSVPVRDSSGNAIGRLFAGRDVTQERAVDRAKTEFVSLVSHELRTPLTSIRGFTELLLQGEAGILEPNQAEFLAIIQHNVDRLSRLVDELLDIARIEAGRVELMLEDVELGPLVDAVSASLRPQLEGKQQRFTVHLPDHPVVVRGDASRVQQILTNLLSNAHKYTPPGGSVTLTVEETATQAVIAVADTGIGLTAADRDQLFRKFFRAKNRMTEESGGSGLGLVITKSLVELHGGELTVESMPGQGSVFRFTLPLASDPSEAAGRELVARAASGAGHRSNEASQVS